MKEKSVTFSKGKSKFLQNQRGEGEQEVITRNWTHKLPHKLPNNLGLMVLGNEGLLIKALMI